VGARLAEAKRPGEIRVFVFGESSVEGGPWGYLASPATMLRDQLHAALPERDLTVINMGRGAATALDSYYFLASIERFSPDYVIFYQGGNDFFQVDRERCWPATHPWLHRALRALIERSRLLWTVRALGPGALAQLGSGGDAPSSPTGSEALCDEDQGFAAWAEVLVSTARAMKAEVIVASPVQNPLRWPEQSGRWGVERALDVTGKSASYRRLLACVLDAACDRAAVFAAEQSAAHYRSPWMESRGAALRAAAEGHGASFVDFALDLRQNAAGGLAPSLFADEVHLSLEGYWRLAFRLREALAPRLEGRPAQPFSVPPPPLDRARYLGPASKRLGQGPACILLHAADPYLRSDMPLLAAAALTGAVAFETKAPGSLASSRAGISAQLALGALRRALGEEPALPALLAPALDDLRFEQLSAALREHPDCSTVGGAKVAALATDLALIDDDAPFMIPGGQEALIMEMLGSGLQAADGCALQKAEVPGTHVRAAYRCAEDRGAVIELHHPSASLPAIARTDRFAIVGGDPAPSPTLLAAIERSIRAREGAFRWIHGGAPQTSPAQPSVLPERVRGAGRGALIVVGASLAAMVSLALWLRRRRARA
jgi:lysophospholipase L1-like esterase